MNLLNATRCRQQSRHARCRCGPSTTSSRSTSVEPASSGSPHHGPRRTGSQHIKKPLNAFMVFMKEMRQTVIEESTLKESAAINQILGRRVSTPPVPFFPQRPTPLGQSIRRGGVTAQLTIPPLTRCHLIFQFHRAILYSAVNRLCENILTFKRHLKTHLFILT